jgi:hypothetical protein
MAVTLRRRHGRFSEAHDSLVLIDRRHPNAGGANIDAKREIAHDGLLSSN